MPYVYRHIRQDCNMPFYIGVGTRSNRCRTVKGRNRIWNLIVAKTDFSIDILFDDISHEEAFKKEKEFIKLYGRIDNKTGCLANMTDGGEGHYGVIVSQERREAMSKRMKGKAVYAGFKHTEEWKDQRRIENLGNKRGLGYRHTDEAKKKISLAGMGKKKGLGKKWTEEQKRKLVGRTHTDETKEKIRLAGLGRKHSVEAKIKMSEKAMGNKNALGHKASLETRKKLSESKKRK